MPGFLTVFGLDRFGKRCFPRATTKFVSTTKCCGSGVRYPGDDPQAGDVEKGILQELRYLHPCSVRPHDFVRSLFCVVTLFEQDQELQICG